MVLFILTFVSPALSRAEGLGLCGNSCAEQVRFTIEIRTGDEYMGSSTISPQFHIVIPRGMRKSIGLKPGQKVQVVQYGERLEIVPARSVAEMRGFLKGMDTRFERDADRV
jgi:AbrB family looped-hinge helix DNA binding protein